MRPVLIESPFAGCFPLNRAYLHAAIRDCIARGETPYASHKMIPGALDDRDAQQRIRGIETGTEFTKWAIKAGAEVVAYIDLGVSPGMDTRLAGLRDYRNRKLGLPDWFEVAEEARRDRLFDSCFVRVKSATGIMDKLQKAAELWCERASEEKKSKAALGWV